MELSFGCERSLVVLGELPQEAGWCSVSALFRLWAVFGASGRAARVQLMLSSDSEPSLLVLAAEPPDSGGSAGSALSRAWWCWQSSLGRADILSCSSERCLVGLRLGSDLTFPIILEPK